MSGINRFFTSLAIGIFAVTGVFYGDASGNSTVQGDPPEPVYVVIMNHVEGDGTCRTGDTTCLASTVYQTLPLPPPGIRARPAYSLDITGNDLIYEILLDYTDTFGRPPKLFIEPAGEWWQTYSAPGYGGKAFDRFDYPALGNEFGIQGHAVNYSGYDFGWYQSPNTEQGISMKFRDLDYFADQAFYNGLKVNSGKTFTGGWKLEKDALGEI